MAQNNFNDGTSGSVVIRTGPPASSGGSGGGFGGGGGVSGGFGKVSKSKQKARAKAKAEAAQKKQEEQAEATAKAQAEAAQAQAAAAQVQEQARQQALMQFLAGLAQRHDAIRAEVDRRFAERASQLSTSLEQEVLASRKPPNSDDSERWQLYLITKEKGEIDGLLARKSAELNAKNAAALSFDGHDPLTRSSHDYLTRLGQFGQALDDGHRIWESAYTAAHEARLLTSQIHALREKSAALGRHHAEQTVVWRAREAVWEAQRQYAAQREARVRFKQQADEDARVSRTRQANTLTVPMSSMTHGAMVLTNAGAQAAQQAGKIIEGAAQQAGKIIEGAAQQTGKIIEAAVQQAVRHLSLSSLATLAPKPLTVFVAGMVYSPTLGDGELTPEQRRRLFQSVAVPAQALGLSDEQALRSIADTGGSVEMPYRLKPEAVPQGTAVIAVTTGKEISASVPVINAVLDPLTGNYTAEVPGSPARHLQFTPDASITKEVPSQGRIALLPPVVQDLPKGVDLRIQDCIICVPGSAPMYLSFNLPPLGAGVVTGKGQPAKADWWNTASRSTGAAIPSQIGDQLRGREIQSFGAFGDALWRTLGEQSALTSQFDEVNKKRVEQGFAPYAPKSTWVGERREFELRFQNDASVGENPFNLDRVSIVTPQSAHGRRGVLPAVQPWPIPPVGIGTWTPLVPPGSEHLGPTTTPISPSTPTAYPGNPLIPILPANETFPAVDEGQAGASIPGFPGDMELPSPDVLFLDRRDDPGVATGIGKTVTGVWLGEAARTVGASIPVQIADQLRGKEFANFHRFREAFWRAVAADSDLSFQFSDHNLRRMQAGIAPFPPVADQRGGRKTFELHHDVEVISGGEVYGIDNILVMTPRRHIQLHQEKKGNEI
ncbi:MULTISPECIES: S-type pyocin domain-containing protein [Pseudomonas]|uniref:S-type pyocin domain-containing protein n=1 Tax=Pseudomonas TaxID=286 RepID=UPI000A1E127E|nr:MULTISPECIES: S-type pyocin domain-containing protein [Pseudomonas]UIN52635.1 S-type pyocin domain-containing protein [Pseudomonas kribbensis]